jgi:hypothetical protein
MPIRLQLAWLPGFLFRLTLGLAALLLALVFVAPMLDNRNSWPGAWGQLFALFGRDAAVRHTSIAAAVGLTVTAWVFFRPPRRVRRRPSEKPPPPDIAGA